MNVTGTGYQVWPLTTGNNDDPTLSPGKPTSFNCNTVPDRCPTGPLAYYLPGTIITFKGIVTQPSEGAQPIWLDEFYGCLFESLDWIQCWHGNQISSNFVRGANWTPMERNALGFRTPLRLASLAVPGSSGDHPFTVSIFVPACSGFGRLSLETMQLALLFRNSQIKVNAASAGVLDSISTGAVFKSPGVTARASAVLVPRQDLVLGPAIEWVLTQIVAGSNSTQIQIPNFGTDTQMQGTEPGGGVITLMELQAILQQEGVLNTSDITQYQFPWRGQQVTNHPEAVLAQVITGMPNDRPHAFAGEALAGFCDDFSGYPYIMQNDPAPGSSATMDLDSLYGWIMAQGADDLELSSLQTADTAQSYFLTAGGFATGSHQVLQQFARSWQPAMVQNWLDQIRAGGASSLAAYCLQDGFSKASLRRRTPRQKHALTKDQTRYLAWQLV